MKIKIVKILFITLLLSSIISSASTIYLFLNPPITTRTEYINRSNCGGGFCPAVVDIEEIKVMEKDNSNGIKMLYVSGALWVLTVCFFVYYKKLKI